jgi:hypothetical protein
MVFTAFINSSIYLAPGEKWETTMRHSSHFSCIPISLALIVLAAASLACNLTAYRSPAAPASTPDLKATAAVALAATFTAQSPTPTLVAPAAATPGAPPAPATPPAAGAQPSPTVVPAVASPAPGGAPIVLAKPLSPTGDACALIPAAQVEALLGEPLGQPSSAPGVCVIAGQSGQRSFTVVLQPAEAAKPGLLGTLAQFKTGCSLSFSGGTNITPTPLPPDIQALSGQPLKDLMAQVAEGYQKCNLPDGYKPTSPLIGDASYTTHLDMGFMQAVYLIIASGDTYASFTYAAASKDELPSKLDAMVSTVSAALSTP